MKFPFIKEKNKDEVEMIDIDKILSNPYQPRDTFDSNSISDLAESIKSFGIIQPLTIRPHGEKYELIAGERRLKAAEFIGLNKVPVLIRDFDNQETAEIALVENLQRKDLDFLEEAYAYEQLIAEFKLTQKELAQKIGKSQSTVANKLRILNLPSEIQKKLKKSELSERHARLLLKLTSLEKQLEVIDKIIKNNLTVRETNSLIKKLLEKNKSKEQSVKTVFKDLRVFTNSLNKTIKDMKKAGLEVKVDTNKSEEFIEYNIKLPREKE